MNAMPEGNAIVYCEDAFATPNGKTAHGLVRRTLRYEVLSVIDSSRAGWDSGELLDGRPNGIPVVQDLDEAVRRAEDRDLKPTHFVIGLAPDGGRLASVHRASVIDAVRAGLNVDSGLHDYLSEDPEISALAEKLHVRIRDVRKPPPINELHFFTGKIVEVTSLKTAVLGTDSAVGKRTTAWILADALAKAGFPAEFVGTGQTAWMQGARYGIILDSLINDFLSGEIEHVIWTAWKENRPDVIIIEGQGSLMNPAYPGGYEILAAGRPDAVVLQHAPGRRDYDGFPGYPIQPVRTQIQAVELISGKPVVALTVNHENLTPEQVEDACRTLRKETRLPVMDVLREGADEIVEALRPLLRH